MTKVEVKYNPYRLQTDIKVDGLEKHCSLQKLIKGKRLQEWIGDFPQKIQEELNTKYFDIDFYGMELDWDDFEESFQEAFKNEIIREPKLHFVPAKSNKDIEKRVVQIFNDLQEGPVEEFRDPKLKEAFDRVNNNIFTINVIGVMSSGKSTLINALLEKNLISSPPIVCTTTITKIIDNNNDKFTATVYNKQKEVIEKIDNLNDETMEKLSSNKDVDTIIIHGDIPFIDSDKIKLMLVDTPSIYIKQHYEQITNIFKELQSDANSLILYVLNGTQLGINDDDYLLNSIAEAIKKGGKQVRDRFLFVINKMDVFDPEFDPEEESIEKAINSAKKYLAKHGIFDPQIFPCSAFTALNLRTHLKNIDIDNLTSKEQRNLAAAAKDTIPLVYKFVDYEDMYLEKYSVISPTTKKEIEKTLETAKKEENSKAQALIHCGIYSIKAAIIAYVKKYAQTKKVKDLVETFQEVLNNTEIFEKAKSQIANNEELARKFAERCELIERKIEAGNEARKFKKRIDELNPMPEIQKQIRESQINLYTKITSLFKPYGDYITKKEEAIDFVKRFKKVTSEFIAETNANLENIIYREIFKAGEKILSEYKETLSSFDENEIRIEELDFNTLDIIKDKLKKIKDNIKTELLFNYDDLEQIIDYVGETTEEERIYAVKVGREQVIVGFHEEKIGTRKVVKGQHKEKICTAMRKNPKRQGGAFWEPEYIEEDIYTWVTDFEDEDIYTTVSDYDFRDVYEERIETIERFFLEVTELSIKLVSPTLKYIENTIDEALEYLQDQIDDMKEQFLEMFDELDKIILAKCNELNDCTTKIINIEKEIEENKKVLNWLEDKKKEIDSILDI